MFLKVIKQLNIARHPQLSRIPARMKKQLLSEILLFSTSPSKLKETERRAQVSCSAAGRKPVSRYNFLGIVERRIPLTLSPRA
jgi:hypothetical protein